MKPRTGGVYVPVRAPSARHSAAHGPVGRQVVRALEGDHPGPCRGAENPVGVGRVQTALQGSGRATARTAGQADVEVGRQRVADAT